MANEMEVTVIDAGDLPASTIISFRTASTRRHTQVEKDKAISLSYASNAEPVQVDLMSEVGSHTFNMVAGQDVYEVPISTGEVDGGEVRLKFQIREAPTPKLQPACIDDVQQGDRTPTPTGQQDDKSNAGSLPSRLPGSPSRRLQTARMMRSYLDSHDVLRQMQDLLHDMVRHRPEDPIQYMIKRLEEVCLEGDVILEGAASAMPVLGDKAAQGVGQPTDEPDKGSDEEEDDEEDADDFGDEAGFELPPVIRKRTGSVSEEAYGAFNQRKQHQKKVIPKDDSQKSRLKEVLLQCWMFQSHTSENLDTIVDAMSEKVIGPDVQLIKQGDEGNVMWVIEEGVLECFKRIDGVEKSVKVCRRGDVFGELALLYSCPRAATVVSRERCVLWELDRETFKAICYEAASQAVPVYEGFTAPARPFGQKKEAPEPKQLRKPAARRRPGVSAEATAKCCSSSWVPPFYEKTVEERRQLSDIIRTSHDSKLHMLFGTVNKETFEKIVDAMCLKAIAKGESVIKQGDVGDFFYIVKSGDFDIVVRKGNEAPKKVFQAGVGFAFGELALLYNAPRSATITACVKSEVWSLDRMAFRNLVVVSAQCQFQERVDFLNGVDIFQVLTDTERAALAEVLEEEEFEDEEGVLEQGEKDDKMFILQSGKAVACITGDQGEVEVMHYSAGDYFGEIALLSGQPRKASVYAVGPCTCLYIARPTFWRLLGPLSSRLEQKIDKYEKYQDAIADALSENDPTTASPRADPNAQNCEEEEFQGGSALRVPGLKKKVRRRRHSTEGIAGLKKPNSQAGHEVRSRTPPDTLAEKVAQDMQNPALVNPLEEFAVQGSHMVAYGGLVLGQKFTQDKLVHVRPGAAAHAQSGEEEMYSWQGVTKLKQGTEISVICQKGQKSASDPTPNQDNFFLHHVDNATVYGVADGHGPFGHLVSFRLVQTLPCFLARSQRSGKDWEAALKEAFLDVQADLVDFCGKHSINIEGSGSACSVVVLEEQTVHVAFIGDSRVMLGSWHRRDSRMVFCTRDHKPELPKERARLEASGSELREVDPGNWRVYLPGSNFPGLTMSRAFGDTACGGVLREPEYHKFQMQPTDQWYCILASDGIWEFMDGEEVCKMTAKKLRLKGPHETLQFLVGASRKRWSYCCGDYCDDITAMLVQWNAPENKDSKHNNCLTLRQPRQH